MTGGASGIGADVVRAFAANASRVAFVDILDDDGAALARETGALFIHCDLMQIDDLKAAGLLDPVDLAFDALEMQGRDAEQLETVDESD